MRTIALVAARMGSTRLPGKSLMPVCNTTLLGVLLTRLKAAKSLDGIVLATTNQREDDALAEWAREQNIFCYRGDSEDVLGRLAEAVRNYPADIIVEVLGDNPFVQSELIDDTVSLYQSSGCNFVSTATAELPNCPKDMPLFVIGVRVQVLSADCLFRAVREADDPADREHATKYIVNHPDEFHIEYLPASGNWQGCNRPEFTFAVNHGTNLQLVRNIYQELAAEDPLFSIERAIEVYDRHPEWEQLMGDSKE